MELANYLTRLQPTLNGKSCFQTIRDNVQSFIGDAEIISDEPDIYIKDNMTIIIYDDSVEIAFSYPNFIISSLALIYDKDTEGERLSYQEQTWDKDYKNCTVTVCETIQNASTSDYLKYYKKLLRC